MSFEKINKGKNGELFVSEWLENQGFKIIGRNVRHRIAEIDIVALHPDETTISFVEVRTRNESIHGHPLETVNHRKQMHIRKAAELFLMKNRISGVAIQFDVASIVWQTQEFIYLKNAF